MDPATLAPWQQLVAESLDVPAIVAFVVGSAWYSADENERTELVRLIGRQIAALYARRLLKDRDATLSIAGAQPIGADEALVMSRLTRRDGSVESIDWRVRRRAPGDYRILDIVSDGQSLAAAKRAEYAVLLQRSRGDVAGLIQVLRADTQ